jgi:para-aminobenzoate synthetase / 4-amino-4-deoxychorismate lyase
MDTTPAGYRVPTPIARFDSAWPARTGWNLQFSRLRVVHVARKVDEVVPVLHAVDRAAAGGAWAVVALAYEAAVAFEPAYRFRGAPSVPLVWAAIFDGPDDADVAAEAPAAPVVHAAVPPHDASFRPLLDRASFRGRVESVQRHIGAGDTYQVNLTFSLRGKAPADVDGWYGQLRLAQQAGFCARLDLGERVVVSLSPELFFERSGTLVRTRPMKGTAARGRWLAEDEAVAAGLATSDKARAENVMIVDLLRNDLGRIATTGSVRVPHMFTPERYPTLWQLTSTIEAEVPRECTLTDILSALFPCGSITGAPKIRTMEIIATHESTPRGLYTGAIGFVRPGGDCSFSVAIRTLVVDRRSGEATLGVGAGITADSVADDEYDECLLKGAFAAGDAGTRWRTASPAWPHGARSAFSLFETMPLAQGTIARRAAHVARMAASAAYFGFAWRQDAVDDVLDAARVAHPTGTWRLRLLVDAQGVPTLACTPFAPDRRRWRVAVSSTPVDSCDPFLCNKTTRRVTYDEARALRPDVDEVLLVNAAGELTEATVANLVVEIDGVAWTPPRECGLLGGIYREALIEAGHLVERRLTPADLERATSVWLVNSLRGRIEVEVVA